MSRKEKREKRKKIVINLCILLAIFIVSVWIGLQYYWESSIMANTEQDASLIYESENVEDNTSENGKNNNSNSENNIQNSSSNNKSLDEKILSEYKGYNVSAKLEIPEIDLETYVLSTYSTQALNVSVTKFWGAEPNEEGNFCVAGHNFKKSNMFRNLKNLSIGDVIFVSDNDHGKVEYKIYDIYKVEPDDVSCLSQDTNGKREVTLITCTNDSKDRIIVKALEN